MDSAARDRKVEQLLELCTLEQLQAALEDAYESGFRAGLNYAREKEEPTPENPAHDPAQ